MTKTQIIENLKKDILLWQGFKPQQDANSDNVGLGQLESVFPNGVFPKGAIHEFISVTPEGAAASDGFIGGLLSVLMKDGAACVWISTARKLFPMSLSAFNVETERIIFIDVNRERDTLWVMEEALKCDGLAAVVAEVSDINLTESRRLQLAVERSGVTGFILRKNPQKALTTVCMARWKITAIASKTEDGMPGVGFPRWNVELLKVKNGNAGNWIIEWAVDGFVEVTPQMDENKLVPQYVKFG